MEGEIDNIQGVPDDLVCKKQCVHFPAPVRDPFFFKKGDNYIYCPVCRKNINAIDVIKDVRNCSIKDAIKELSEIEGIVSTTVPRYNSNSIRPSDIRMVGIKCSDDSEEYFSKKEFKEYIKFCIGKTKDRIHEISEFLDIDLKEEAEIKKIERKL